ncbi:MAG: methyltransferase domain-containing protein [Thermodesulfobacteriota bacterium]
MYVNCLNICRFYWGGGKFQVKGVLDLALSKREVRSLYQSGAKFYDLTTILYRLIGLRMKAYRALAIEKLSLHRGDCVIELGCGTGLNFPALIDKIGVEGKLIGVDLTPGMLDIARLRVDHFGWKNVELVQSDIVVYEIPKGVNGVLATGLFGYIGEYDRVIKAVLQALVPGGYLVILDGKQPAKLPAWLFRIVLRLGRPFGFTPEYFKVKPWESVERYFQETKFEERYGGLIYISSGAAVVTDVPQELRSGT